MELQTEGVGSRLHVSRGGLGKRRIGWIDEQRHDGRCRHQLVQKSQPLRRKFAAQRGYARYIAAWPVKAGDEPKCNRISASEDDDRDCRGGPLCRQRRGRRAWRRNYTHPAANQISGQNRQALVLSLGPPVFDRDVLALDKSGLVQTLTKNAEKACEQGRRFAAEKSNHRHRWLLRARSKGPRGGRRNPCDDLPPPHSITSSARARMASGTARPSAAAVLKLSTSSYLVGACTARSAGFSPFRMRWT